VGISFTKKLRPGVRAGEITESLRYWHSPRVKVGSVSRMEGGTVTVTGIRQIEDDEIDDALARRSGFASLEDMLSIARHGPSEVAWLVTFIFEPDDELPI
jgi:hypothetical protein